MLTLSHMLALEMAMGLKALLDRFLYLTFSKTSLLFLCVFFFKRRLCHRTCTSQEPVLTVEGSPLQEDVMKMVN